MKKMIPLLAVLLLFSMAGCGDGPDTGMPEASGAETVETPGVSESGRLDAIPFRDDQLYGVAYLGYEEMDDLSFYAENYLGDGEPPIYYFSGGEYYLIIPRYPDMAMRLYKNDMETMERSLVYEAAESRPFIIQCNVSDIFPDATISLTRQGETVEFSPFISLKDGSVEVGERGLDLTHGS